MSDVMAALHSQVRAIADGHGVTTDTVMLAIGLLERDLSVIADPRLKERLQLLDSVGDEPRHEALRRSVREFLKGAALLGVDVRNPEMKG